jgi:hypothetical protein
MADELTPETVNAIITYLRADRSHSASLFLPRAEEQRTHSPSLPFEITDMIIDHLHGDKPTLAVCGLTCKEWLSSSRYHLFSKVVLNAAGSKHISSFSELLAVTSNSVASAVRHLTVRDFASGYVGQDNSSQDTFFSGWQYSSDDNSPKGQATVRQLCYVTSRLHAVKSFSLCDAAQLLTYFHGSLHTIAGNLGGVEVVEMDAATLDAVHALDIISYFPALKVLSLADCIFSCNTFDTVTRLCERRGFQVQILDLVRSTLESTVNWLLACDPIPPIHTLRCFAYQDSERSPGLSKLFTGAGRCIERLEIHLNPFPPDAEAG